MNSSLYCNKTKLNNSINDTQLLNQYYSLFPDFNNDNHKIIFGTSGHRGSALYCSFNEAHVLAISQSIVQVRSLYGIKGPCYVGKDTHILSDPALISVLEVLAANCVHVIIQKHCEYTPTPVISHAIINYNKKQCYNNYTKKADGIIITSSHNSSEYGGIKYSSIYGGPASINITNRIEQYANQLLIGKLRKINRIPLSRALSSGYIHFQDFMHHYVKDLNRIINMNIIKFSGLKLGVDPLSGSSVQYWQNIAQYYQLNLTLIDEEIDRTFSFMYFNNNTRVCIDCASEASLKRALKSSKNFDLFFVNDPDCDRHGIITPIGLIQSNYYFSIVIHYLFHNRLLWDNKKLFIGKTNVSSTVIDQVVFNLNRNLLEVPVGFKWFAKGLFDSTLGFAGEDIAGASFLDYYCMPWSTDKDGFIMCLLAAEIVAVTNQTLQEHSNQLNQNVKESSYNCTYMIVNNKQKFFIINTLFDDINMTELTGDPIIKVINITSINKSITMDGVKIITSHGWIACRLSGTELVYKIYCESFVNREHRQKMETEMIENICKIFR